MSASQRIVLMVEWVNTLVGIGATAIVSGVTGGVAASRKHRKETDRRLTILETQYPALQATMVGLQDSQDRTESKVDSLVMHLIPPGRR